MRPRLSTSLRFAPSVLALGLACALVPAQAQQITAGSITNSPPMIAYASDGTTLQGVIVELAAAMSQQMGRKIEFKAMPFAGLLPAMQAKNIDVAFSLMNDTAERQKVVDFVDFFDLGTRLLVQKGNPEKVSGLDTLCGKKVATVKGSTQLAIVEEANAACKTAGKAEVENLQYSQPSDARMQVQTGRVSAFLGNSPVMVYLAKNAGDGKIFDVAAGEYQPVPLGIAAVIAQIRGSVSASLASVSPNTFW